MTGEELRIIRNAMDRLALSAEDEDDASLVESVIARAERAERQAEALAKALEEWLKCVCDGPGCHAAPHDVARAALAAYREGR